MKFVKLPILWFVISGVFIAPAIMAQTDTTNIRITEETVEAPPTDKNMKWVRIGEKRYDMDNIHSMLKIEMSPLYSVGELVASGGLGSFLSVGYEHKIPGTQWSAEVRASSWLSTRGSFGSTDVFEINDNGSIRSQTQRSVYAGLDLTVRYYPFKGKRIAEGKSGNNLWGLYGFFTVFNAFSFMEELETVANPTQGFQQPLRVTRTTGFSTRDALATFGAGYRKRFFNRAFFDVFIGITTDLRLQPLDYVGPIMDFRVGYSIFKLK